MLSKLVNEAWKNLRRGMRAPPRSRGAPREQLAQARRLLDQGDLGSAHDICAALLALDPGLADGWNMLGGIAFKRRDFALAAKHFAEAIALAPERADLHNNYGYAMAEQLHIEEAVAAFRRAVAIDPRDPSAHPNLLWLMNLRPEFSAEERYQEHCRWAQALAETRRLPARGHDRDPDRALRIGYVSSDFRNHAVGHFIEPILAHHDRARVVPHCYSNSEERDAATERMRALVGGWRDIAGLPDDRVEALVGEDRIDILIDLSGHTRGNRLRVFARRPAPVQVTFLGYPATTGMPAVDYRLTDALADPPGAERHYRERLCRLPRSLWCYFPREDMPGVSRLPALASGQVTFGSMNGAAKLNPAVIAAWSRILDRVPWSRLLIATVPRGEAERRIRAGFDRHGIGAQRLEIIDRLEQREYRKLFARVDVALDPFPCNGGTTTCESLWMGVPVVSLAGDEFRSRAGLSLLTAAGLPDLIARSVEEYVDFAAALAGDLAALAALRSGLRERLKGSPLADIGAYVAALEAAYRAMWRRWCRA